MHASIRRDLALIVALGLLLYGLVEFRASTTSPILQYAQGRKSSSSFVHTSGDTAEAREGYEDVRAMGSYPALNPSALHYHKSSSSSPKPKHRHIGKAVSKLSSKEQQRLRLMRRFPITELVKHAPGFTILDNVYLYNGTLYIVRADTFPNTFPERRMMISSGAGAAVDSQAKEPTDSNMQIISASKAVELFGERAFRMEGTSFMSYDNEQCKQDITRTCNPQLMCCHPQDFKQYFHFSSEILFSLWRTYASLDPRMTRTSRSPLSPPSRLIAPHVSPKGWRDYADMNQYVFHAAFPPTLLELDRAWKDRAGTGRAFVLDRIVLEDRLAAARGEDEDGWETMLSRVDRIAGAAKWWWEPVRRNVAGEVMTTKQAREDDVVITYVTRQGWGRRMLREEDHERLVAGLRGLEKRYGWEVNVVKMEDLKRQDQIALAARTTILMGVHGSGLTSLLWMRPDSKSTVMEFFAPEGISHDFQYPAKMLGIRHFGFWKNVTWTEPDVPRKGAFKHHGTPEGFHGSHIPLDADTVVSLCVERLISALSTDDTATPEQ